MSLRSSLSLLTCPLAAGTLLTLAAQAHAAPALTVTSPALGEASERALLTVAPPLCDGVPCWTDDGTSPDPQAIGLRRVYLNFEGVTLTASNTTDDATLNQSFIASSVVSPGSTVTISPFNRFDLGSQSGAENRQQIIDYTLDKMREYHSPYNFEFTTTRPSSGQYNMIVFGGTCGSVAGTNCAGIALLDCTDASPNNIVFAFPAGLRAVDLATTATQELAHALGLKHTLDTTDFMYPQIQTALPTHYGAGAIPNQDQSDCGGGSFQDSHEKLLSVVGFPGQDGTPPSVLITSPANGDVIKLGDAVLSTISDSSPISKVEFSLNNTVIATKTSAPFDFEIPADSPLGQVRIDIRATDNQGNEAGNKVTVYIGTGAEEPCDGDQCADGFTCVDMLCYPDAPVSSGALGDFCVDNESCDSSVCADFEEEKRCSQSCDAETLCPEGFECLADTACWPKDEGGGGDSGLCAIVQPGPGAMTSLAFLFFALAFGRRRRRHS